MNDLRAIVEEAMSQPIGEPITLGVNKKYPNEDEVIAKSRDLISMTIMQLIAREPKDSMAFKYGLVDEFGVKLREPINPKEHEAFNAIERLAFSIRALLGTKARTLRVIAPKSGIDPSEMTANFLVLGRGVDRGAVEKYLNRLSGKSNIKGVDVTHSQGNALGGEKNA